MSDRERSIQLIFKRLRGFRKTSLLLLLIYSINLVRVLIHWNTTFVGYKTWAALGLAFGLAFTALIVWTNLKARSNN
jgi:hypothetical protein